MHKMVLLLLINIENSAHSSFHYNKLNEQTFCELCKWLNANLIDHYLIRNNQPLP
jgi:hypothetical protein